MALRRSAPFFFFFYGGNEPERLIQNGAKLLQVHPSIAVVAFVPRCPPEQPERYKVMQLPRKIVPAWCKGHNRERRVRAVWAERWGVGVGVRGEQGAWWNKNSMRGYVQ